LQMKGRSQISNTPHTVADLQLRKWLQCPHLCQETQNLGRYPFRQGTLGYGMPEKLCVSHYQTMPSLLTYFPSHHPIIKRGIFQLHSLTRAILPCRHQFRAGTKSVSSLLLELWDKQIVSGTWRSSDDIAFAFQFYLGGSPSFLGD
jgi:hypothetical protein